MKILITVKTYPCKSKKYQEIVCTAGVTESGQWIRLYPIQFRNLDKHHRYKKYQWVDAEIIKDTTDPRKESYKISGEIKLLACVDTQDNWKLRKQLLLHDVYFTKKHLIYDLNYKGISLAIFKPTSINDFIVETTKEEKVETLPFKFYYKFLDSSGQSSRLQIIDWEIYQLCRKLLIKYGDNYEIIIGKLKEKFFTEMLNKRDVYLFLGTNKEWHIRKSLNPFMIIGIFYPPKTLPQESKLDLVCPHEIISSHLHNQLIHSYAA